MDDTESDTSVPESAPPCGTDDEPSINQYLDSIATGARKPAAAVPVQRLKGAA